MAQIANVIKFEGDNNIFIWKHPCEDFNSTTQLIVHESQEAIFFMNGQALDLFGPGRHTLETQNIPLVGKALKKATDGDNPFHCEVYFINKTVQMAFKWGTDSRVRFLDPTYGMPLDIGASGELNLMVSDSRKLLVKLVGTTRGISWGNIGPTFTKSIYDCFRPLISTAVKTNLSNVIKENNINILEVDSSLDLLSEALRKSILPGFEEYGLTVPQVYVTNVALPPETDPNFKNLKELYSLNMQKVLGTAKADVKAEITSAERRAEMEIETTKTEIAKREAEREIIKAQAEAEAMRAKGYDGMDLIKADVQKAYAEGIGNMTITGGGAGDVIGLGVGVAAAGAIAPQLGEMLKGMSDGGSAQAKAPAESTAKCAKCGAPLPANAKFCLECGEKVAPAVPEGMIVCPECGKTVAKGKFCLECGHKFITVCPKCGEQVVPGAKFCLECGEKL